jgi:heme exporter protein A
MRLSGDKLGCRRGGRFLFRGLAFSLATGGSLLIEGPNGSGKTTLIRAIAGLGRFDEGSVALQGGADDQPVGEAAHYVGHFDAAKPLLTVQENLAFWSRYLGGGGDPSMVLSRLKIEALRDLPAQYLSAGQRRKLALARLLLVERPIWLLDEPTVSLDTRTRDLLAGLMEDHVARGGILIAITHVELGMTFGQRLRLGEAA